jgi:hypothetical protein
MEWVRVSLCPAPPHERSLGSELLHMGWTCFRDPPRLLLVRGAGIGIPSRVVGLPPACPSHAPPVLLICTCVSPSLRPSRGGGAGEESHSYDVDTHIYVFGTLRHVVCFFSCVACILHFPSFLSDHASGTLKLHQTIPARGVLTVDTLIDGMDLFLLLPSYTNGFTSEAHLRVLKWSE